MQETTCFECGQSCAARNLGHRRAGQAPDFCSVKCKDAFYNRRKRRGAILLDAALYWRTTRDGAGLIEMCKLLDGYIEADVAAGRDPAHTVPAGIPAGGWVGYAMLRQGKRRRVKRRNVVDSVPIPGAA